MFRLKPVILTAILLIANICNFSVSAQTGDGKSNSFDSFFGFNGLRTVNVDNLYNEKFLRDSTYVLFKEKAEDDWSMDNKLVFDYDNQGKRLSETSHLFRDSTWSLIARKTYSYNSHGLIDYRLKRDWSDAKADYENSRRTFFYYDRLHSLSEEIHQYWNAETWELETKVEYTYNADRKLVEELAHVWMTDEEVWRPNERTLFEYNSYKRLTSEIFQIWDFDGGQWINQFSKTFAYDDDQRLINYTQSFWDGNMDEWVEQSVRELQYNESGQVESFDHFGLDQDEKEVQESLKAVYDEDGNLENTVLQYWNTDEGGWEMYEMQQHFWSTHLLGNVNGSEKEIVCSFSNPYSTGTSWRCSSLIDGETYSVEVFDINGKLLSAQQVDGGHAFRLTAPLENGLYMVVIRGGLTVHSEKVLVRN